MIINITIMIWHTYIAYFFVVYPTKSKCVSHHNKKVGNSDIIAYIMKTILFKLVKLCTVET